ncbi:MAG TPA: TFIIB-type zinc ribbon-containing protein [Nitrososphaeraceae archaeon]|jgi:transcription initiation factor TFIIB|nr:TFIIB-type zinc ribbon-containing protein [Nitrososphaeraceae archaeon]
MTSVGYCTICPECNSRLIHDQNKGEYICERCGCVVMDQINDYGPESHSNDFEEKSKLTRASGHTSLSLHDYGLRTEIGFSSKDYSGKNIDYAIVEQMNTMRKWQSRIRVASPKERRLSNVLYKINEICSLLSLPKSVTETAAMFYRIFENRSEAKGKSVICIAAATIYLACKKCNVVRSLEEIVNPLGSSEKSKANTRLASKYYRSIVMEMGMFIESNIRPTHEHRDFESLAENPRISQQYYRGESDRHSNLTRSNLSDQAMLSAAATRTPILSVMQHDTYPAAAAIDQYISKLANMAKIDTKVERLAIDIAHKTNNHLLADGKSPHGLAAAYIYLASVLLGVSLLQMEISSFAGITEVTIRNRCKDILSSFKITVIVRPLHKQ